MVSCVCCLWGSPVKATLHPERTQFDVGVLALRGHVHTRLAWQPTMSWLEEHNPGYEFKLHTYDFEQLESAFLRGELDFMLTSPGQATKLAREYQIHWLATQKTAHSDIPDRSIASVVVVRQASPYKTLNDLNRTKIAAVSEKAFGGFLALRYELDKLGYFTASFFENIHFTGPPTDRLVFDVIENNVDVAIVPACTLENMVKEGIIELRELDELRVINEQRPAKSKCAVSTPLYPNWTMAMTKRAPAQIGQRVAQTLFAMPEDHPAAIAANNIGWMLSTPGNQVDEVYKHLNMHPLQKPLGQKIHEWLYENRTVAVAGVLTFVLLTCYHFWLQWRFRRSRDKLRRTLNDLRRKSSMLEHAQRITIVGELGSSLAHEINQPLAAIKNYSQGAKVRMERGASAEEMQPVLEKIQQQVTTASAIVQRLRSLIHKSPVEKHWICLTHLIEESIKLVDYEFQRHDIQLGMLYSGEPKNIYADATGLQQVILNVLNNAKDACLSHTTRPDVLFVDVHVDFADDKAVIEITDNGVGIEGHNTPLEQAFYTTKENGLGLGLAICREVIEGHQGNIRFRSVEPTGCQVTIVLPYQEV
ncbi:sensor histidine kinase [Vibrio sp. CAU 1672]|uniref:sensor histidine kinase n=1 Tax=Vibrio sp. CAU 1672 TaxID=3032594 RepID=UPI0023DAB19C|nr:sensor histidine kinase [Vibrio sp. CAU 1672]MDF2152420.1 sensor histidine kinase [Vibrio sp. CAU 1672]